MEADAMSDELPHNYFISDDTKALDFAWTLDQIRKTYFGVGRTEEQMIECCRNSLCFGIYRREYLAEPGFPSHRDRQVGFARVVTDRVLFGWLADFFVDPELRGRGLGFQLMHAILSHHALRGVTINLGTRDAQDFYTKFGFKEASHMMLRPHERA